MDDRRNSEEKLPGSIYRSTIWISFYAIQPPISMESAPQFNPEAVLKLVASQCCGLIGLRSALGYNRTFMLS